MSESEWLVEGRATRLTFVQLLEALELRCEATLAGRVDNKDNLALHLLERERLAFLIVGLEVVEFRCGRHGCGWCITRPKSSSLRQVMLVRCLGAEIYVRDR